MALVICIILIALVAFAMYDHISPQLPKEWQIDKKGAAHAGAKNSTDAGSAEGADATGAVGTSASSRRWTAISDGVNSRLERTFSTAIHSGGRVFDAPVLFLQCSQGSLYAWIDTRLHAAAALHDPANVAVQVNSLPPELWVMQEGQNISSPSAQQILALAEQERPIHFTLAFTEAPSQTLTLNTDGFGTVAAALASCKH